MPMISFFRSRRWDRSREDTDTSSYRATVDNTSEPAADGPCCRTVHRIRIVHGSQYTLSMSSGAMPLSDTLLDHLGILATDILHSLQFFHCDLKSHDD